MTDPSVSPTDTLTAPSGDAGGSPVGIGRRVSRWFYGRPGIFLLLLLLPPLLWLGIVYVGSLFALLLNSFFAIDPFTGMVKYELTLATWKQLFTLANLDIIMRTVTMAACVTVGAAIIGFPLAHYMARYAGPRIKGLLYLAVMLPLWSSYLVRLYAWKLILAKEGIISWIAAHTGLSWLLDALLALPVIGGPSLSVSYIGMFLVFLYIWLPFMILPIEAALERVPRTVTDASADLGARPGMTFRKVILPLAFPGVVAGSIFTFSLTLGDYIIPGVVGSSRLFIGQAVYLHQGTAGNLPLAAAFSTVPIVIMAAYLMIAKRLGAFNAL
ncbi:ABC transporter permease [Afifella aestuarii]|uniref:ABC transporter permease n=1 Tax=Afifella aestuarii TaxID=1909496 RepID=UPI000FE38DB9|nr:ABC transporter permease [Afifella aestuarii]